MKATLIRIKALTVTAILSSFSCIAQEDSLKIYWKRLSNQFIYRANVAADLANFASPSSSIDSIDVFRLSNHSKILRRKLAGSHLPDRAFVSQIESQNDSLVMGLGRMLVMFERNMELRKREEFRNLLSNLEGAENRILYAKSTYNSFCERTGRKVLQYKPK